jgi:hypothetical protein
MKVRVSDQVARPRASSDRRYSGAGFNDGAGGRHHLTAMPVQRAHERRVAEHDRISVATERWDASAVVGEEDFGSSAGA